MRNNEQIAYIAIGIATMLNIFFNVAEFKESGGNFMLAWTMPISINNILAMLCVLVAFGFAVYGLIISRSNKHSSMSRQILVTIDFAKMKKEQIDALMNPLKDMSSAQIESFIGNIDETTEKRVRKPNKKTTKKKDYPS